MTTENKLIAEFMGYSQPHPDYPSTTYWYKQGKEPLAILSFDRDWNWLMEVVERIEDLGNDVSITSNYIKIAFDNGEKFVTIEEVNVKIQAVYQAVVEFINYYKTL